MTRGPRAIPAARPEVLVCLLAALALPPGATAQTAVPGTLVIISGQEPITPVPMLARGRAGQDVADQLFLRLARLGPSLRTAGDTGFVPELARRWTRRDSVTLAFEIDSRAKWHDGRPVTARDVVVTLDRARDPATGGRYAVYLGEIAGVTAEGDRVALVRFRRAYGEQLYDATYHVAPLPAHLVEGLSDEALAASPFGQAPVGNGPYRWVRRVPGQLVELEAVPDHYLGRPGLDRLVIRTVADGEARLNLMLTGEGDALEYVAPPLSNLDRLRARPGLRIEPVASGQLGYILFNYREPADRTRPHPILGDSLVRRAIVRAVDRETMVRSVYGAYAAIPDGPTSQLLWIRRLAPPAQPRDTAYARRLLASAGWVDRDNDGVLDRDGRPLELRLQVPATSQPRRQMALQLQEQLRPLGIRIDVQVLEIAVFVERRDRGDFDLDFAGAAQDPSPSGLRNSWSCASGGQPGANVGWYCNPGVDSLVDRARFAWGDPDSYWREVLARIQDDAPAIFLYAPATVFAVSDRYRGATIRPESPWAGVRNWSVEPSRALPRDRTER
ncbi:MAG: peptide ABC transporter substrate-binding protein [Gemmatimonadales bacterium]